MWACRSGVSSIETMAASATSGLLSPFPSSVSRSKEEEPILDENVSGFFVIADDKHCCSCLARLSAFHRFHESHLPHVFSDLRVEIIEILLVSCVRTSAWMELSTAKFLQLLPRALGSTELELDQLSMLPLVSHPWSHFLSGHGRLGGKTSLLRRQACLGSYRTSSAHAYFT